MRRWVKRGGENDADYDFVLPRCRGQEGRYEPLLDCRIGTVGHRMGGRTLSRFQAYPGDRRFGGTRWPTEDRDCAGFGRLHRASLSELVDRRSNIEPRVPSNACVAP